MAISYVSEYKALAHRMIIRPTLMLALLTPAVGLLPTPSFARDAARRIDIAAGPLTTALSRFSELTGISVGFQGDLTRMRNPRVSGSMDPEQILAALLRGTGLQAVRITPRLYRIERRPASPPARLPPAAVDMPPPPLPVAADILVTAQKRTQYLSDVPISLSIIRPSSFSVLPGAPTSRDISYGAEGLAVTNLGPGRNRQFIRGVADSPFNGQSQSTVAVQVDNARVTFNAPDPDLRLIDVERIEILKGPQGPLYGSGALGGIYHIVTHQPELADASASVRLSAEALQHGGVGAGAEALFNLPLVTDRLAIRGVGYRIVDAGWIDNSDRRNSNSARTLGQRLSLRWQPTEGWTADAGVIFQDIVLRDSQYVLTPNARLTRPNSVREPTENDFKLYHATIRGDLGGADLIYAASYIDHAFDYELDASAAASDFGVQGSAEFEDERAYTIINQEVRLSSQGAHHWLIGASYMRATSRGEGTITDARGLSQTVEATNRLVTEYALFGEASVALFRSLKATAGARLFRSVAEDESTETAGRRALTITKTILSPSLSLSLPLRPEGLIYLRYARAMRPGGLAPLGMSQTGAFEADELGTLELGMRHASRDRRLSLSMSGYYTLWNDIQSDYLLANGLVSTRGAGRGRIVGLEASAAWQFGPGFTLSAGGAIQDGRLTHRADGIELDDRRLPIAPAITARLALSRQFPLGRWQGQAAVQGNYVGSSRLSFDDDLDRKMGNYALFAANSELTRGPWTVGMRLDNLLNVKGDTFAFGNPFSIRNDAQYTPMQPRTVMLSIAHRW